MHGRSGENRTPTAEGDWVTASGTHQCPALRGSSPETRTRTVQFLRLLPLPIGLESLVVAPHHRRGEGLMVDTLGFEPRLYRF